MKSKRVRGDHRPWTKALIRASRVLPAVFIELRR
jgi:hypothetical protein